MLVVEITEQGRALRDKALDVPPQVSRCVSLTGEEAVELYRLLYKMLDCFREQSK